MSFNLADFAPAIRDSFVFNWPRFHYEASKGNVFRLGDLSRFDMHIYPPPVLPTRNTTIERWAERRRLESWQSTTNSKASRSSPPS